MTKQTQTPSAWPPKIAVCVGAVVLQGERALFVRQATGESLAGQWSIPWGIVEPDETPEQAALRETREEAGIEADIVGLLGIQNLRQPGWLAIVLLCRHISGIPIPDGGVETDQAGYFSLGEINHFNEPFEPWCKWVVSRMLQGDYQLIPPVTDNPYHPRIAFL